jgi:drug/metabolite transporter (DMT)-like permease
VLVGNSDQLQLRATSAPPAADRIDRRALAAASVTVVLWASAFVAIRSGGRYFDPGALALGRLLAGSLVLGAVWLARGEPWPARAAWPGIICTGVLWFGVYMVALNWGEQHVDAGTAAMIVNIGPVVIALLGGWLLREGFPRRLLAGLAVSFAGAVVVGLSESGGGRASLLGVAMCLLAAVAYATAVVSQKPALRHASALQVTTFGCFLGTVATLPFAGRLVAQVTAAPLSATLTLVYLGVFPTALAFTTWAYALNRTTAGKMGATTYLVPALVVLMSWAILGQTPTALAFLGGALCLAGVAVSRKRRGSRRAVPPPAAPLPRPELRPGVADERPGRRAGRRFGPPGERDAPPQHGPGQRDGMQLSRVGPGDGLGQQGHAETPADELSDQLRVACLKTDAGPEAHAQAAVIEVGAQAGTAGQADQHPVPDDVQAGRRPAG